MIVIPETGNERVYEIPVGKHLRVHEGDLVRAGDRLSEGPVNPHDILRIKGPRAVQEYLLNEVQEVYRLQGVKINDKHIGVIVRQMLQKVRIAEPGDTEFLEGETVDRMIFLDANQRVMDSGEGTPATSRAAAARHHQGQSLTTQSFISAASFQETTRVLTDAAIRGARDDLIGLKENIIIGHLIPAGTGVYRYQDVEFARKPRRRWWKRRRWGWSRDRGSAFGDRGSALWPHRPGGAPPEDRSRASSLGGGTAIGIRRSGVSPSSAAVSPVPDR